MSTSSRIEAARRRAVRLANTIASAMARDAGGELAEHRAAQHEEKAVTLLSKITDALKNKGLAGDTKLTEMITELGEMAMGGTAVDAEPLAPEEIARVLRLLRQDGMADDVIAAVKSMLTPGAAADEPPAFSGRPRPGGTMDPLTGDRRAAHDAAASDDFSKRFPGAARIGIA